MLRIITIKITRKEILNSIMSFIKEKLEPLFPKEPNLRSECFKMLANCVKRFISLALSGGITEAILFAYSKAKVINVNSFLKGKIDKLKTSEDKIKEEGNWVILLAYLYDSIFQRYCDLKNPDLIAILNSNCLKEVNRNIIEKNIVRHLLLFARVIDAYGD